MQKSIADAGLIIAYLNASESCHAWAVDLFAHHEFFYTCEAVLSEACARLAYAGIDQSRVIQLAADGVLRSEFNAAGNWERILKLMEKYADQPMDFADACLVAMCEDCRDPMVYQAVEKRFFWHFLCKKPNDFEGHFSKTWLFQQPATHRTWMIFSPIAATDAGSFRFQVRALADPALPCTDANDLAF